MDTELLKRTPDLRGLADIKLVTVEDGPGRGQRLLIARNAGGISFEVAVDRGFDLAELSFKGSNIGWHSPNQMPFPAVDPDAEEGWGFLRNIDGFLVTCGLDHFGRPEDIDISTLNHPHLQTVRKPLHGRIAGAKARLLGYGVDEADGTVWAEGSVRQSSVFGEVLELKRRITLPLHGGDLMISDKVTNLGFLPIPHALLYHINFGYPFLQEGLVLDGLPAEFLERFRAVAVTPRDDFGEIVDLIDLSESPSSPSVTIKNPESKISVTLGFSNEELPSICIWRAYQSGLYALGVEPCTGGKDQSISRLLQPRQSCDYSLSISLASS